MRFVHRLALLALFFSIAPATLVAQDKPANAPQQRAWKAADGPLMTRWGKEVTPDKVHPEYPRPQMVRDDWTNLNGLWDYAVRPAAEQRPEKWDGAILVPFPIESALSGVMKRVSPSERLWYRRQLDVKRPTDGKRVLLHFGAVDWQTEAFVNGKSVGTHTGGYDPFTFDITDALSDGDKQELIVAVSDPTDANWQPRGKQVEKPRGIWYTPTTGIWQTVWLEEVPKTYIEGLTIVPDIDSGEVRVSLHIGGSAESNSTVVTVLDGGRELESVGVKGPAAGKPIPIKIEKPKLWSPDSPFLYTLRITTGGPGGDEVRSYFGMRKIALGKDKAGVTRLMLNNEPVFQYGPLDQGFWPDGLYTAPSDEALKYDLEITKKLGFNMVRKHVKTEPARWYYHCDKLGLLVWQDMPSGDKHAPWNPMGAHDGEEIVRSPESAENFRSEWKAIIDDLRNYPSIVVWVPFNEAWGQFDTVAVTKWTQQYDPTRLVNCASGGNDFPVGDIYDLHRYPGPTIPKLEDKRAAVLGEFGGLGLPIEGHTWQAKDNWGYRSFKTKEELATAYEQLMVRLRPLVAKGLSAAIYTQTTDVEIEVNGLLTYDREVLKVDLEKTAAMHRKLSLPPPKETVVVPTSQKEPLVWRYTTEKPADGWQTAKFDDSSWKEGPGGFGEPTTPGSVVRTLWKTPDIWLRRTFTLPQTDVEGLYLLIHFDEDSEVYLNGKLIATVKGYATEYGLVPLDAKTLADALVAGENTLAVHCNEKRGGQYIDVGLVKIEEVTEEKKE